MIIPQPCREVSDQRQSPWLKEGRLKGPITALEEHPPGPLQRGNLRTDTFLELPGSTTPKLSLRHHFLSYVLFPI